MRRPTKFERDLSDLHRLDADSVGGVWQARAVQTPPPALPNIGWGCGGVALLGLFALLAVSLAITAVGLFGFWVFVINPIFNPS